LTAPSAWCYGGGDILKYFFQKFLAELSGKICRGLLLSVPGCTGCTGDPLTLGDPPTLGYLASFHFDQTSVSRVHTVCERVSAMPRASGHSLALRLDSRATILATEYLAIIGAAMYLATVGYLAIGILLQPPRVFWLSRARETLASSVAQERRLR